MTAQKEDILELLTELNLEDLIKAFGWEKSPALSRLARILFRGPAAKFALHVLEFEQEVGKCGLIYAAEKMLSRYIQGLYVIGREHLPQNGPILVLSNHPGMSDALSLLVAIRRPDVRIIGLNRPFLQALPNVRQHLFFVEESPEKRMVMVRQTAAYLRQGGAVLTFPAGQIEPDPQIYPDAGEWLEKWTDSVGIFLRLAPETKVIPAVVQGVLWKKALYNPITVLRRQRSDRDRLGAALQLLLQVLFGIKPVNVSVRFGEPIGLETLGTTDPQVLHEAIVQRMSQMFRKNLSH